MAITDLATLRTRFLDWADNNAISTEAADEFVQFSTHTFNYGSESVPALRTRDMVETTLLTPSSGVATLPEDYLQFRSVTLDAATPRILSYVSPDDAVWLYGSNSAGLSNSYTIVGNELSLYPSNASDVTLVYYQKIPELVEDADTNWVIEKHPNLYLHTALYHLGIYRRDVEQAQAYASLARAVIGGIGGSDMVGTYGYAPMRPRGMTIA